MLTYKMHGKYCGLFYRKHTQTNDQTQVTESVDIQIIMR